MIYLDSAATSLLKPPKVKREMLRAMETMSSPGRGSYKAAMDAADKVYECRILAAKLFNFPKPENVVFTMNATHALNIAIRTLAPSGGKVVISGYEHNSVTRPLHDAGADICVAAGKLFDAQSVIDAFKASIDGAQLAVCNHVSNVFGFIQPVREISDICARHGVPLIIDASQSAGVEKIDAAALNVDFIAMPGHKGLMGPQGTGILLCRAVPKPLISGGTGSESVLQSMPQHLPDLAEAGTHNVVGIAGLCEGIRYVLRRGEEKIGAYEAELCRGTAEYLERSPNIKVFRAGSEDAQAGVLSIQHTQLDCEQFCESLGRAGIAARCGLHCAPLAHKSAGTLERGTVRLSFSPFITRQQAQLAAKTVLRIADKKIH